MKKYGIMMGRFQPFHFGHQHIVNEIMLDGLIPVILVGSCNEDRDLSRNPLSFEERYMIISRLIPEAIILRTDDNNDWDKWYNDLILTLKYNLPYFAPVSSVFYHNDKDIDRLDFTFNNKQYINTFYTDVFKDNNFDMKKIDFFGKDDFKINVNARDIRSDIEKLKHFLDARTYWILKTLGW
jgi:nicotinamide mononucleotide adenylyltransferase